VDPHRKGRIVDSNTVIALASLLTAFGAGAAAIVAAYALRAQ
jgi:hypothetical protein